MTMNDINLSFDFVSFWTNIYDIALLVIRA